MADYFIAEGSFGHFVEGLAKDRLYGTVARDGRSVYERLNAETVGRMAVRVAPPVESLKGLILPIKERVAVYPSPEPGGDSGDADTIQHQVVVGARACEVRAVEILDKVMLEGEFPDPFYEARRRSTVVVSTDCIAPDEFCFCNMVGGKPFAEGGFDLNLSPIEEGYFVEIGSDAGKELVLEQAKLFREASQDEVRQRDALRKEVGEQLRKANARYEPAKPLEEVLKGKGVSEKLAELASACVECGACTFICPTCHCFLLYDRPLEEGEGRSERIKSWDSCVLASYAKMAGVGGAKATPRPRLVGRFENRMRHKFEWMLENLGQIGCVGCGRCTAACAGGSDIREVIHRLGSA